MKILYFTSPTPDNLEDGILHGLRSIFGPDCIDYPKKDVMYRNFAARDPQEMYGRLFTIWRTLDDIQVDRTDIDEKIRSKYFDWIIFGAFTRTQPFYRYYRPLLEHRNTILLDGNDLNDLSTEARKFLYFKRELEPKASYYYNYKLIPPVVYNRRQLHRNVLPIAFAIPKEKITAGISLADKTKPFPVHIVDAELAEHPALQGGRATGHIFTDEQGYYHDLQSSRFGVTMKRGGWDCLRHYEIAANGAVICFRNLAAKKPFCAPHGLDASNAILYSSADDLLRRIDALQTDEYAALLEGGYRWIAEQTTEARALQMMEMARAAVT
jgi:hypothetical protein